LDGQVAVWRCHVPRTYNNGYIGRAWAFVGFMVSACCAVLMTRRPDVVIASSPPLTVAVPGRLAGLFHRVPVVFEVRDLWPESAVTTGILNRTGMLTRVLYRMERWAYRWSAMVNVLTPAFRDDLLTRGLVPASKVVCVPNGADVSTFAPGPRDNTARREFGWGDRVVAMYAGAHGKANAIGQLVETAEQLRNRPEILIATVGDGPERARWKAEAESRGLDNIQFCGPQPKDRMPEIVRAADIGLAVLQNNPTFKTVYPNKVFDYMACERPTVLAIDGIARQLVCDEARAGLYAQPENAEAIAQAITALADDQARRVQMGINGRSWVLANATRESMASAYLEVLARLVTTGGASTVAAASFRP
jgi:glycosyltransferase involved in cell wall biosynthesis